MKLNKKQSSALASVEWLLGDESEHQNSGRSVLIAITLIRRAARDPGRQIRYVDHRGTQFAVEEMRDRVLSLIQADPGLRGKVKSDFRGFNLVLREPIPNWLPQA